MKKIIVATSIAAALILSSCGDDTSSSSETNTTHMPDSNATSTTTLPAEVQSAIDANKSSMTQELKDILSFMGNEERLAYDVYNALYLKFPDVKQLYNIPTKSEYKHIVAVQLLVRKYIDSSEDFSNIDLPPLGYKDVNISQMQAGTYDIKAIQDLYDALYAKGIKSKQDALEVGCMVEVTDINDLNMRIPSAVNAGADDIVSVLNFLRDGSYSHYHSFDSGLKNMGLAQGCCTLGIVDGVDYCQPDYPKNNQGNQGNQGRR